MEEFKMKKNMLTVALIGLMVMGSSTGVFADTSKNMVEIVPAVGIEGSSSLTSEQSFFEFPDGTYIEITDEMDFTKNEKVEKNKLRPLKINASKTGESVFIKEHELIEIIENDTLNTFLKYRESNKEANTDKTEVIHFTEIIKSLNHPVNSKSK
jgi:hypothetical protein